MQSLRWPNQQGFQDLTQKSLALVLQKDELFDIKPVTSVTIGENIDLEKVRQMFTTCTVVEDEVVEFSDQSNLVMVLANGTLVGWGLTEDQMGNAISQVKSAVSTDYNPESEEMDYVEVAGGEQKESFVHGDIFVSRNADSHQKALERAAFAIGLSRSTRLSILEESLEKHIQLTRENSEFLSKGLELKTKEAEILKLTGRLFLLRGKLNLYSELIETPDLYWSEPNLEKIYESVSRRLDILLRILIMNRKLDYITEEQRALLTVLNEKKSTRLEWIIILLIMVEVGFETFHFWERWDQSRDHTTRT